VPKLVSAEEYFMASLAIPEPRAPALARLLSKMFAGEPVFEEVASETRLAVSPEVAWSDILFYEDVRGKAPLLLRCFLPCPVRTEGAKGRVGAKVRCIYSRGYLIKRISVLAPPYLMRFEIVEQHLGIEGLVLVKGGGYELYHSGDETDLTMTTRYRAFLHPRWLWRPVERLITRQLHAFIVRGMRSVMNRRVVASDVLVHSR
jgi:hypothetical protein